MVLDSNLAFLRLPVSLYDQGLMLQEGDHQKNRELTMPTIVATPVVMTMKSVDQTVHIFGCYGMTPKSTAASTSVDPADFIKCTLDSQYLSKIYRTNAYLRRIQSVESKPLTTIPAPKSTFLIIFLPFCLRLSSSIFRAVLDKVIQSLDRLMAYQVDLFSFGVIKVSATIPWFQN